MKTLLPPVPLSRFNGKQLLPLENKIIETKTETKTIVFTPCKPELDKILINANMMGDGSCCCVGI